MLCGLSCLHRACAYAQEWRIGPPTVDQQVEIMKNYFVLKIIFSFLIFFWLKCADFMWRGRVCMKQKFKKSKINKKKLAFSRNLKFSKSVEQFKSYTFFPSIYKKKVQEWTEGILARRRLHGDKDDCCQKPVKNYFHLTPKIGPLCNPSPPPPPTPPTDVIYAQHLTGAFQLKLFF